MLLLVACSKDAASPEDSQQPTVPHENRWGIYVLNLNTQTVRLIYSPARKIDFLHLNSMGDRFVFMLYVNGDENENQEICTLGTDGTGFEQITTNTFWDLYPCWSPDDTEIVFLSFRDSTLDIYRMDANGDNQRKIYDSGFHDADVDWQGNRITFTRNSQIWIMRDDGTDPTQVTNPPNAGVWGNAVLPFGDYDPRFNPNGDQIVFERMVGDSVVHGCYDLFSIQADGTEETRLTQLGYTMGLVRWSSTGDKIVFLVSAIGIQGVYDIYTINPDGSGIQNVTPAYFPANFLCHCPLFSLDDSVIYFIGEWWE
jgi:Tol biopolymer transport system component